MNNQFRKKAVFNWSGGKDSALALYKVLQNPAYEVVSLLTTVNSENHRSSIHGIPIELLQAQAESIGIPLYVVEIPAESNTQQYGEAMQPVVEYFKESGVRHFIFGDIFLHDIRSYREEKLSPYGIEVVEPLWNQTSPEVMKEFLKSGLRTIIITTAADKLTSDFIGRVIDAEFVNDLPEGVDICGENGEYHTFCFDGPIFRQPIPFSLGDPFLVSHTIRMEEGQQKIFSYWHAPIK